MVTFLYKSVKHEETFTATGIGQTIDVSNSPLTLFSFLVLPTGVITAWIVDLEGSLDGSNWTIINTHTNLKGSNIIFPGVNIAPVQFFRANCTLLTLGAGTNIKVSILGTR